MADERATPEREHPLPLAPMVERRSRVRLTVWYSIVAALIVAGLLLPLFFGA